ncbi:MAG: beta-glucosidase [Spirochaetes bacterium]|nr:MAG: beta-glucosidase [Spirochaetota bacterium]
MIKKIVFSILLLSSLFSCSKINDEIIKPPEEENEFTDEELLDLTQEKTFNFFWKNVNLVSGLTKKSLSTDYIALSGASYGVLSILIGVERGYITRQQAVERMTIIVQFLSEKADRFHGAWAHWFDTTTGVAKPFSPNDDGADLVETGFMIQALLTAQQYFTNETPEETLVRNTIQTLYEEVEWDWFTNGNNYLLWHWSPNYEFEKNLQIKGWNEAMITYILAIASPTHSIPVEYFHTGWVGDNYVDRLDLNARDDKGGNLFTAYSSFRSLTPYLKDKYIIQAGYKTYHERARHQALLNREWCISKTSTYWYYSEKCWGITSSKDPAGYKHHKPIESSDNGTIAPTAAFASMPYTPEESLIALHHFHEDLKDRGIWNDDYGFYDAFNFDQNWIADDFLALDQGPLLIGIENYRTGFLWDLLIQNQSIKQSLQDIGFEIVPH